jgi:hypothetical protein
MRLPRSVLALAITIALVAGAGVTAAATTTAATSRTVYSGTITQVKIVKGVGAPDMVLQANQWTPVPGISAQITVPVGEQDMAFLQGSGYPPDRTVPPNPDLSVTGEVDSRYTWDGQDINSPAGVGGARGPFGPGAHTFRLEIMWVPLSPTNDLTDCSVYPAECAPTMAVRDSHPWDMTIQRINVS